MSAGMDSAIAYCRALGLDPDEPVSGYVSSHEVRVTKPRWQWYLGASPATAEGALELSPVQRRRLGASPS